MMLRSRRARHRVAELSAAVLFCLAGAIAAKAQDNPASAYREIETKYIFGFTEGSSIGLEGEKEISSETVAGIGKRDGRYFATQTKLEFEHTPTQFFQFEVGPLIMTHNIRGVTDLDDRNSAGFGGLFGELRYLLLGRGPESPIGVTVSFEPVWRRVDETSGARVTNFEGEMTLHVDTELVQNRVYLGFNAIYEPEWMRLSTGDIERESTLGFSGAIAFRPVPRVLVGIEAGYFRHYDGFSFNTYTGDALFVGPTLYVQLTNKAFMTAAWGTQVRGRTVDNPNPLNLTDFPRNRAKLKFALEF
jgi:hypothetical protein